MSGLIAFSCFLALQKAGKKPLAEHWFDNTKNKHKLSIELAPPLASVNYEVLDYTLK